MAAAIQISLELAFGELLIKLAVVRRNVSAARFKTKPKQLEKTLKSIEPIFYDSSRLNQVLDHPERYSDKVLKTDNLIELALRNLINLSPIRKEVSELDGYCDAVYVTHEVVLSEFAIHLSSNEPVAERKRLFIEVHGNKFPTRWIEQIAQLISTQILSMSTDEKLVSNWYELIALKVEVLILNIHSKKYTLPQFIERMDLPKVLRITAYNLYPSQLHRCNLRRIKFEHASVSSFIQPIFVLQNLRKPLFVLSNIGNALISCTTESSPRLLPDLLVPFPGIGRHSRLEFVKIDPGKYSRGMLSTWISHWIYSWPALGQVWSQFWRLHTIEKVNWWMNQHESELYNSKINVVEDYRVESFMENIHEEATLIGCMVHERHNSQSCGSDFSHDSPPSLCDVAPRCASTASEYNGAQNGTNTYYNTFYANSEEALSIGCVVLERQNSQSCGSDLSSNSLPSYCDVATRCGSTAIKYNGSQNGANTYYNTFYANSEEALSIGCVVLERQNSQSCGSDFSCDSLPSYCDVATRCGSTTSAYNGAHKAGPNDAFSRPFSLDVIKLQSTTRRREREGKMGPTVTIHKKRKLNKFFFEKYSPQTVTMSLKKIVSYYNTLYAESEEALSIGCVVLERQNSQSCGSDFSCYSLPSYCDVATRCGSTAIKYNGSQNGTNTYYNTFYTNSEEALSIGCVVLERQNSQSCGSDFSYDSLPSYCDVATRCGSTASAYNGAHKAGPNGAFSLGVTKLQSTKRRREREGEMGPTATIHKKRKLN